MACLHHSPWIWALFFCQKRDRRGCAPNPTFFLSFLLRVLGFPALFPKFHFIVWNSFFPPPRMHAFFSASLLSYHSLPISLSPTGPPPLVSANLGPPYFFQSPLAHIAISLPPFVPHPTSAQAFIITGLFLFFEPISGSRVPPKHTLCPFPPTRPPSSFCSFRFITGLLPGLSPLSRPAPFHTSGVGIMLSYVSFIKPPCSPQDDEPTRFFSVPAFFFFVDRDVMAPPPPGLFCF